MSSNVHEPHYDAVVIGAGITGIYQVHSLLKLGMAVKGYEAGSDVGGTWYWNRYPGARLDTESYAYGYFALNGIIPEWQWKERFASQPELLQYVGRAADAMDVRNHRGSEISETTCVRSMPAPCSSPRTSRSGRPACSESASDHGPSTSRPATGRP